MSTREIREPSPAEQQKLLYNRHMRAGNRTTIKPAEKVAVCLLRLAPGVTRADYATLRSGLLALEGIDGVELLLDARGPASIPADTELVVAVEAQLRIEDAGGGLEL